MPVTCRLLDLGRVGGVSHLVSALTARRARRVWGDGSALASVFASAFIHGSERAEIFPLLYVQDHTLPSFFSPDVKARFPTCLSQHPYLSVFSHKAVITLVGITKKARAAGLDQQNHPESHYTSVTSMDSASRSLSASCERCQTRLE